eukprot:CAMPEP_0185324896 /NCGR_PEP_ID=MMETSP1363-20130426/65238_1 /TAXON_ID=38817 /ORGANISM="Gephyrocapsa oceanica, Strain RCC1303" /LENGTH=176 /DNA_ID=CAMNT_0027923573 /DNA_START=17 /DNA_END=548 /DNA_ORIENTATION=-
MMLTRWAAQQKAQGLGAAQLGGEQVLARPKAPVRDACWSRRSLRPCDYWFGHCCACPPPAGRGVLPQGDKCEGWQAPGRRGWHWHGDHGRHRWRYERAADTEADRIGEGERGGLGEAGQRRSLVPQYDEHGARAVLGSADDAVRRQMRGQGRLVPAAARLAVADLPGAFADGHAHP